MAMALSSYMVVRVSADGKSYEYWTVDPTQGGPRLHPSSVPQATRTTSASTLGTAVQNNMPTLST